MSKTDDELREEWRQKFLRDEVNAFKRLIIEAWRYCRGCNSVKWRIGQLIWVETPKIKEIVVDPHTINFSIRTGRFLTGLPIGVNLSDLMSDETLQEMSRILGRQIEAHLEDDYLWYRIYR